ncbi:HrpA-like RNA helicase [Indivirus ILV1]|uniref:RNA helicase n=1 Tax=Indivirus ILV1 TaxID=1977633 RepID=A0A1V0SDN1_9VIRU|nr:HrpA-like RNA helicase [Indivirus ILV1]
MEPYFFIKEGFKLELQNNVINKVFKNLNIEHKSILLDYLIDIIDVIAIKFGFNMDKRDEYERQFTQNNYKDAVGLLYLLLPFINENVDKSQITSLDELYIEKKENININKVAPKYKYSNLQYGRCNRNNDFATEIKFSKEHLEHNYILLLDTIKTVANKLYVNWINIRPINNSQLNTFRPLLETIKTYPIDEWNPMDKKSKYKKYQGLDISEIYNVTANYLYHEIYRIKWILYELIPKGHTYKTPLRFLDCLSLLFDIDHAIKNIKWQNLDEDIKKKLNNQWNNFIHLFEKNEGYDILNRENIAYMLKTLIVFFDRYGSNKIDDKEYVKLELNNKKEDKEEDEDDIVEDLQNLEALMNTASSLKNKPEYIYEYIRHCLYDLRSTYYAKFYLEYNKDKNEYEYKLDRDNVFYIKENYITVKNLYNYAKSLISYVNPTIKKYIQFPKYWKSLNDDEKNIIKFRINHTDDNTVMEWFNLGRYLQRLGLTPDQIKIKNIYIHTYIRKAYIHIIYEILADMGLLSEFVPDSNLSNYTLLPEKTEDRNKEIIARLGKYVIGNPEYKKNFNKSTYFLNGLSYENIVNEYKDKKMNYLDALVDPDIRISGWITTYAMDWISQIGFYHHYLNNRVIYVTGSTGVGKSTQTPKLFLYALKMLDYKNNGKIICTQPRIAPTRKNAKIIADELGVPIFKFDSQSNKEIDTNNYSVQYKYKGGGHENKEYKGLLLKITTDGTLEQQLENPVLKIMSRGENKNYGSDNVYDIVMVDEAHEHGKNMDLILTKMKYVSYYNNNIKLVIISATMDDDEPVYRRYYRDINDNRIFPLNLWIEKYNIDRINVDRRIHISPPGETTQYKITEYDRPNSNADDLVIEIINTTSSGDILLFKSGEADIKKARDYINSKTDSKIIALPFFSKMTDKKREFIEEISKNKSQLDIPKSINFEDDYEKNQMYKKVPKGTYSRVIIIATNIAEASITIPTLKYVVDTGNEKVNMFNYKMRSINLIELPISESSRLQRKGRVGRTSTGTVYYTYNSTDMKKNKIKYEISMENISEKLFEMLKSGDDTDQYFTNDNDPNKIKNMGVYEFSLDKMIEKQYFTGFTFYKYQGNKNHYDYQNNKSPYDRYVTGFNKNTLDDKDGSFYIVHPDELCFERNILGHIVSEVDIKECNVKLEGNIIESAKMKVFWEMLSEYLLIVQDKDDFYKTQFGENIMILKTQFENSSDISMQQIISYIYSRVYNCEKEMIKLISMYLAIQTPKDIIFTKQTDGKYRNMLKESLNLYGNKHGDSAGLIKIANQIISNPIFKIENLDDFKSNDQKMNLFSEWCEKQYLSPEAALSFIKKYNGLLKDVENYINKISNIDQEITNIKLSNLEWFDEHTPQLVDKSKYQLEDRIKIALLHGYSYNIVKNIAIINNNYYYINIYRPSIKYVYNIPKLYKVKYIPKEPIVNNSFISNKKMYTTLLYINLNENNKTGDDEITFIESIPPNIISQVIPQIIDTKEKYDLYTHRKEIDEYMKTLGMKKNTILLESTVKNYIMAITDIKGDLYNNYDKNIFEKLKVIDDRPTVKKIITDMFRNKKSEMLQIGGFYRNSSYLQDIISLILKN